MRFLASWRNPTVIVSLVALGAALVAGGLSTSRGESAAKLTKVSYQLAWLPQAEFAGFYVADSKGWYKQAGLDVALRAGGPNVQNPARLLATGAVDIAEAQPSQVYANRSNGIDAIDVFQFIQGPESLYVAKKKTGIKTLKDVVGKRVGLWFGGDEFEFQAMLRAAGIDKNKVKIFAQGFTIIPWLQDKYEVMQVTPWNEFQQVLRKVPRKQLTIFSAEKYGTALTGDGIMVMRSYAQKNAQTLQAFLTATARGWAWALANPVAAAKIVVAEVPTLKLSDQVSQMRGMIDIACKGATMKKGQGLGYIDRKLMAANYKVMKESKLLKKNVPVASGYTLKFWKKVPAAYKHPRCAKGTS